MPLIPIKSEDGRFMRRPVLALIGQGHPARQVRFERGE